MTLNEVRSLVAEGESEQVEFKKSTGQRRRAAETVCGMLNGQGGFVFFGVRSGGNVTGQEVSDKTLRQIMQELRKIEPQIALQPETLEVTKGKSVVALRVPGDTPEVYTYDGRPYVRQGPTTTQMRQARYRQHLLANVNRAERWEAQPAHKFVVEDLDHAEITRTVGEAIRRGRLDEPGTREPRELLTGLGLIRDGQLLNAAVVLFGQSDKLLPYYPQCLLRMARFRGITKDAFIDNRQEYGHAFDLMQRAQRFMRDHLPIAGRIVPNLFERKDDPLYPMEALREALANAFCHRSYTGAGGSVGIAIYDDRLEVTSTGTLPTGVTVEDLKKPHESKRRNDLIAGVFYRRGIIEQWGRGTLKMAELNEQAGLVPPEFEERSGAVVVRFLPTRYVAPSRTTHDLSPLQQELLTVLGNRGPMALSEIIATANIDVTERTVQRNLNTLRDLSMVRLEGHGRGARWMIREGS